MRTNLSALPNFNIDNLSTPSLSLYIYIYICINIYIYMVFLPKTSSGGQFLGFKISKSRGREGKLEGRQKKEEETWRHENSHLFGGFFLANFNYKTGEISSFLTNKCPPIEVSPIYIYMHT